MALRFVAPAGAPIGLSDLARWVWASTKASDGPSALGASIRTRFSVPHCHLLSTGRAGLTVLLRALQRLRPGRTEVLVPAYTCYSVAASIVKAGLRPRLVDVSPDTLDIADDAAAAADFRSVLALVATNLYGFPSDMLAWSTLTTRHDVFLIDDAAQAMGATLHGRLSGTWGDCGLFSLDKGKNVSAIDGGIIVTAREDLDAALAAETAGLRRGCVAERLGHMVKLAAYVALLHPSAYWIPASIPQLGLGRTVFTTSFPLERIDPALAGLGDVMLRHLNRFTATRRANAHALAAGLGALGEVKMIRPNAAAEPAYLRMPVRLKDARRREVALRALLNRGIGGSASYPTALTDVDELRAHLANPSQPMPGARELASTLLTLPTHPFVTPHDIDTMVKTLAGGVRTACAA